MVSPLGWQPTLTSLFLVAKYFDYPKKILSSRDIKAMGKVSAQRLQVVLSWRAEDVQEFPRLDDFDSMLDITRDRVKIVTGSSFPNTILYLPEIT